MSSALKVCALQFDIKWEDIPSNLATVEAYISDLDQHVNVFILPEMFTTGFTMKPEHLAETMEGPSIQKMKAWSKKLNAAVCGSLVIKEQDQYFNRFVFVHENGKVDYYDKRHLFSLAGEGKHFTGGKQRPTWEYKDWRICPQICYDLRFPVWSRNTSEFDLLIYVASWPKARHSAWEKLLQARAIENQSYVIGVNRCGLDGNGYAYKGGSMIIDYMGDSLQEGQEKEKIISADLDMESKEIYREKYPFLDDRDNFAILEKI